VAGGPQVEPGGGEERVARGRIAEAVVGVGRDAVVEEAALAVAGEERAVGGGGAAGGAVEARGGRGRRGGRRGRGARRPRAACPQKERRSSRGTTVTNRPRT
jgi:hypothetical protein